MMTISIAYLAYKGRETIEKNNIWDGLGIILIASIIGDVNVTISILELILR